MDKSDEDFYLEDESRNSYPFPDEDDFEEGLTTIEGFAGLLMTAEEFKSTVLAGSFNDDDGYGALVKDGRIMRNWRNNERDDYLTRYHFHPSEISVMPSDATHVLWFNK